ncbi:hypothetical protein Tco_1092492 [Tanacetum coccineum]|uniref:Uncharacterized protein n=1 Tax=Tanacetum coccineum TaxID=301880 RepID=A0ABQ5IBA7_9ASTR
MMTSCPRTRSGPRCQDTIFGDVNAQTRFESTSIQSIDPPLSRGYTLGSGEDTLVDKKRVIVTESSIRRDLYLDDAEVEKFNLSKYIFDAMVKTLKMEDQIFAVSPLFPSTLQVFINQQLGNMSTHKKIFVNPFHTKKVFANMKRAGKDFSGRITPLFDTMMVQPKHKSSKKAQRQEADVPQDETEHEESVPTPSNDPQPSGEDSMQLTDLMILCTKLQTQVLDLQKAKDAQAKEIDALKKRIQRLEKRKMSRPTGLKRLSKIGMIRRVESSKDQESLGVPEDASKHGRSIKDIDADVDVSLVDETQERQDDDLIFDSEVLEVNVMHVEAKIDGKDDQSKKPDDSTAGEAVTTVGDDSVIPITNEEITLAQTLIQIKATKPKVITTAATTTTTSRPKDKGVVVQEPSEFRVPQKTKPSSSKDKGKGIMIEPEVPLKRKDQIALDEQIARDIQAKLDAELLEEQIWQGTRRRSNKRKRSWKNNQRILKETKGEEEKESEEVEEDDEVELKKLLVIKKDEDIAIDAIPLATKLLVIKRPYVAYPSCKQHKCGHSQKLLKTHLLLHLHINKLYLQRKQLLGLKRLHGFLEVTAAYAAGGKIMTVRNRSRFGINKWYQSLALRNFDLEDMELESINSAPTTKLPIIKLGEYKIWAMRIKQYFQIQDYALWEVIENGDSWVRISIYLKIFGDLPF